MADQFSELRDACSPAARNLGLVTDPQQLSPEHWQRAFIAIEMRARMRGDHLPDGWREELAEQMGRAEPDAFTGPES